MLVKKRYPFERYERYPFTAMSRKLSLLLKMGFSLHEIATLIGRSYDAIYSSQTRLLKKVFPKGSDYSNWHGFITSL